MDEQFEIELLDANVAEETSQALPVNFLTMGQCEVDDVKVYIRQDVYKALEKLSLSDTDNELGSILIGSFAEEAGKTHVVISDFIEAKYTDASAATLTFTHETWDYVHQQRSERFPDSKIVGWHHTHPGYGIFLSNYDLFIQENFFNLPFQIAYVVDPVQNLRGFFQWKSGKVEKLKGFFIYDEPGVPIKIRNAPPKEAGGKKKVPLWSIGCIALLIGALGLTGYWGYSQSRQLRMQTTKNQELSAQVESQSAVISENEEIVTNLTKALEAAVATDSAIPGTQLISLLQEHHAPQEVIDAIDSYAQDHGKELLKFTPYVVAAGDSLAAICKNHGLDYDSSFRLIMALNGIKNENQIYAGQTILLPVFPMD